MGRILFALALCCASTAAFAVPAFKGMSYTSFNNTADLSTAASDQSIANMKTLGVNTVALNVWWFQSDVHQTTMAPTSGVSISTFMNNVQHAIDTIHAQGMNVFLKPMLDVNDGSGTWCAYINPTQPDSWFGYNAGTNPFVDAHTAPSAGSYGDFIDKMADLANANSDKVSMFSVGCELNNMEQYDQSWRNLIDNVRTHYSGPLTYSANWSTAGASPKDPITVNGGYNNISWWNKFDAARGDELGIDAYFPVASSTNTSLASLKSGWNTVANTIDSWRTSNNLTDKRLLFTETGYSSYDGTAQTPYASAGSQAIDEQEQADSYNALLSVMSAKSYWDGAMWWNWETSPNSDSTNSFSPQNKLVQDVLASNYGGTVPALSLSNWTTTSASAAFTTASNWAGGAPNQNFIAQFSRGAAATYTVTLASNRIVDQLRVGSNNVTFQSSSATARTLSADDWHTDTSQRSMIVGVANGDIAVVNAGSTLSSLTARAATLGDVAGASGTLNLTNSTNVFNVIGSSGLDTELIVGRGGTGTLTVQNGAKVNVNGTSGNATLGQDVGSNGIATVSGTNSAMTVTGALQVGMSGQATLTVSNSGKVTAPQINVGALGKLLGDGTLVGAVQNSGIVAPGNSPGSMHVTGTFTQNPTGVLQFEIGGTTPGTEYDQLLVSGCTDPRRHAQSLASQRLFSDSRELV